MIKLDIPLMFLSLLVPIVGSFSLPFLAKRMKNKFLAGLSFTFLIIPPLIIGYLAYIYGLDKGVVEIPFFQHSMIGSFSKYLDWLSGLYILGIGVVTPLVGIYSKNYMETRIEEMNKNEEKVPSLGIYYMLYVIFSISMSGVVLSTNLLQFYLFLKITVIASFFLILLYGYGNRQRIAFMYLIWSSVAGFLFLTGSLGKGATLGTFNILDIQAMELNLGIGEGIHILIPLALFIGLLVKKAIFGAHIWLPFAHAEAPTPVSALLSPNLIGISGWAMVRIVYELFPTQFEEMALFFMIIAYITMIYGGIMALAQNNLKRLMAYISVSQMGWVVFGFTTMTTEGIVGGVILFVKHSLSLSILFMSAGVLISYFDGLRKISEMKFLFKKIPFVSLLMSIGFFILLGLPLTIGFWSKAMIFSGATEMAIIDSTVGMIFMAVLILIAGSLTGAYSFITLKRILFENKELEKKSKNFHKTVGFNSTTIPMFILAALGIIFFFLPDFLLGPATMPDNSKLIIEAGLFLVVYIISYYLYQGQIKSLVKYIYNNVEMGIIDYIYHKWIPSLLQLFSENLQIMHTGVMNTYMFWMLSGFIFIIFSLILL